MPRLNLIAALLSALFLFGGQKAYAVGGAISLTLDYTVSIETATTAATSLYDMKIGSGTAGDFAVCFDSAAPAGLTVNSIDSVWSVMVASQSALSSGNSGPSDRGPTTAISVNNGLVCIQSSARTRTHILYGPR